MMLRPSPRAFRLAWRGLAAAAVGLEAAALVADCNEPGRDSRTLTATVRHDTGLEPWCAWSPVGVAALAGFHTWAAAHLITGRWPRRSVLRRPTAG